MFSAFIARSGKTKPLARQRGEQRLIFGNFAPRIAFVDEEKVEVLSGYMT